MAEPVILLDFDGVLNAFATFSKVPGTENYMPPKMLANLWPTDTWRHIEWQALGETWPIKWSTDVVRQVNALHGDGYEIRWHSTWQTSILPLARHMGLPELPIHTAPEADEHEGQLAAVLMREGKPGWWKYPAAERVLTDEQRPLIWIDDDLTHKVTRMHRGKMGQMGRFLPLMPDETTGLTPRHFRLLGIFLENLNTQEG